MGAENLSRLGEGQPRIRRQQRTPCPPQDSVEAKQLLSSHSDKAPVVRTTPVPLEKITAVSCVPAKADQCLPADPGELLARLAKC